MTAELGELIIADSLVASLGKISPMAGYLRLALGELSAPPPNARQIKEVMGRKGLA